MIKKFIMSVVIISSSIVFGGCQQYMNALQSGLNEYQNPSDRRLGETMLDMYK